MEIRSTPQTQADLAISYLRGQTDSLAHLEQEASTGLKLIRPSDGPLDVVSVLAGKAQDQRLSTYIGNIASAQATLNSSVSNLQDAKQVLDDATQLASAGANSGNSATDFQTMAQQVDGLITHMISLGNAQDGDHYLYGGTASTKPPFVVSATNAQGQPQTVSYVGSPDRAQILVNQQQTVDTNYQGNTVFQNGSGDVFQALIGLRDLLRNTGGLSPQAQSQALSQQIGVIDQARQSVLATVGEQSANLQNLQALDTRIRDVQLDTQQLTTTTESADITDVIVKLQEQQNTYQLTLATTAKLFDQNLLDFLKG
jgi:flagellar hook-associated protein 3 FlgL